MSVDVLTCADTVQDIAGSVTSTSLPSYVPNAGSSITANAAIPPPSSKVTTSIIQPSGMFNV